MSSCHAPPATGFLRSVEPGPAGPVARERCGPSACRTHARHGCHPCGSRAEQRGLKALLDQIRTDLREALKLKEQLDAIAGSIQRTKQEIATLHSRTPGGQVTSVTDELGAVVCGTEAATNCILAAAEEIDEITGALAPRLTDGDAEMAQRISDKVITIFEACNFQDITGQRISKVVNSMKFIEERVTQMAHIWGGLESFSDVEAFQVPEREGDEALLNGPALDGDPTRTSQDDIDALFG
ncbi:protein phosphatase CheZ [Microvirga aerilata]|uniref:protein phosphatase CheZ n=1 Tax=Microvirga aerilata TaxID=670292 RepID=UPI003634DCDD